MTHLSLITLVCWHIVPRMVSLTEWLVWHENSTKGQHQQLFSSPIYQQGQKISSFYDFCSSIYSHYYSWNWIVSSISRAHCDVISPLCAKMNYFRKNIVNFYGKLTLVYLISRVFLALDSQNFLAHCALLKMSRQFEEKNCFYCK